MNSETPRVQAVHPEQEVEMLQRLPYFVGISRQTVGASGLSMHLVVVPPGARAEPHVHVGYETGIYVPEGTVCTHWGAAPKHEVMSRSGESCSFRRAFRTLIPANYRPIAASKVARALLTRVPAARGREVLLSGAL